MKLSIKWLFYFLTIIFGVLAWILVTLLNRVDSLDANLMSAADARIELLQLAGELRQSSDELTRFARMYVVTGKSEFLESYAEILQVRNGKLVGSNQSPRKSNLTNNADASQPVSIEKRIRTLPYSAVEKQLLLQALHRSNKLSELEYKAFSLAKGYNRENNKNLNERAGDSGREEAINMLNSAKYLSFKRSIIQPVDQVMSSVSRRSADIIQNIENQLRTVLNEISVMIFLAIVCFVISAFVFVTRFIRPIAYLTDAITQYQNGNKDIKQKYFFPDEIGRFIQQFFSMKKQVDDELKRVDLAMMAANQSWFDLNPLSGEIIVSEQYPKMLGYSVEEFHTSLDTWQNQIHPDDRTMIVSLLMNSIEKGKRGAGDYRRRKKDGGWIWLHAVAEVVEYDNSGRASRVIGIHRDITTEKSIEQRELMRRNVLEMLAHDTALYDILNFIVGWTNDICHADGCCLVFIDPKRQQHGDVIHKNLNEDLVYQIASLTSPDQLRKPYDLKSEIVVNENIDTDGIWQSLSRDFTEQNLKSCWSLVLNQKEENSSTVFLLFHETNATPDDQDKKNMELSKAMTLLAIGHHNARQQERLFLRVFNETHEGIFLTDQDAKILQVNPTFTQISGYSQSEAIGKNPRFLSSGKHSGKFYQAMWQKIGDEGYWHGELWNKKKDGSLYTALVTITVIKDEKDQVLNYICLFSDITEMKNQQKNLEFAAHYDLLTQLPKRSILSDRFTQIVAHSKRDASLVAVCFIDLDHFKPVNDTWGHDTGDLLLIEVSQRIKRQLREEDTLSRLGGDEFVMVLGGVDSVSHCENLVKRVQNALNQPFIIEGKTLTISASIGITLYPVDNADLDELIRHADQAMYEAKNLGRNQFRFFNTQEDRRRVEQQIIRSDIDRALDEDEFELYYQPIVNMATGEVIGVEALIRWNHPQKGILSPIEFLPYTEGGYLDICIGNWVMEAAIAQSIKWNRAGLDIQVSVNISPYHLQSNEFFDNLQFLLEKYPQLKPAKFQIELLESGNFGDISTLESRVNSLKELGFQVALDDFGTGYSSLAHLRKLSIDTLKIDQLFVRDLLDDPNDYSIIDGTIQLAKAFNRKLIGEGVSSTQQGLMLLLLGCRLAQGFVISPPMPAARIPDWLNQYQHSQEWLECGRSDPGDERLDYTYLKLVIDHWCARFLSCIQKPDNNSSTWPVMNEQFCHCGIWIQQNREKSLFPDEMIDEVDRHHQKFHQTARLFKLEYEEKGLLNFDLEEVKHSIDTAKNTLLEKILECVRYRSQTHRLH